MKPDAPYAGLWVTWVHAELPHLHLDNVRNSWDVLDNNNIIAMVMPLNKTLGIFYCTWDLIGLPQVTSVHTISIDRGRQSGEKCAWYRVWSGYHNMSSQPESCLDLKYIAPFTAWGSTQSIVFPDKSCRLFCRIRSTLGYWYALSLPTQHTHFLS